MSEALSLLAAVAEHADTLNHDTSAPSRSLRRVEQSGAANGVASTFCQEAELANMVCGVVENYVKRTVPTVMSPTGQQQGALVNLELLLQLATLVVGIVRRNAAVATAVAPGQSATSLTSELQLMDVLVKTLNSQDDYPQQQLPQHSQQPQQFLKQQPNPTAFQLLMQHGSSSCLSSDSTLVLAPAEAAAASHRGRFDLPSSPNQQSSRQPAAAAAAALDGSTTGYGTSSSSPLPVSASSSPSAGDVVGLLKQLYYSNNPSAAAAAMALAAKLAAAGSGATPAAAPVLRSLPIAAQGAAAAATGGQVDAQAYEALAALAALQQQHQYLAAPAAADIVQHQSSSSLERLSLNSSGGACGGAAPQHAAAPGQMMDPSVLIATLAAVASAGQADPSRWSLSMSAAAAAAGQGGLGAGNLLSLHPGYSCTPPPTTTAAAEFDAAAVAAVAVGGADRAGKADRYREKRAARASGVNGVKSAAVSPTAVTAASAVASAAAASQMRRSASYQAALNDLRHAQQAAAHSDGGAAPMVD